MENITLETLRIERAEVLTVQFFKFQFRSFPVVRLMD